MAKHKVKECPFCGGEGKIWTRMSFDRLMHCSTKRTTVLCDDCGCRTQAYAREEDAVAAWNRRQGSNAPVRRVPWFLRLLGM